MTTPQTPAPQHRNRSITMSLTQQHFTRAVAAAGAAGLTPSEWAHNQIIRALAPPDSSVPLGPQYAQLFMEQLLSLQSLLEESLERTIAGTPPITRLQLDELIDGIDSQKGYSAQSLLATLSSNPPLPPKKG